MSNVLSPPSQLFCAGALNVTLYVNRCGQNAVFSSEALGFPCPCSAFETRDGTMYKKYSSSGSLVPIHHPSTSCSIHSF